MRRLFDPLRETGRELARALRAAAKRPTFSLAAIATLAIGIGASTATFSIAHGVLLAFNDAFVVSATGAVLGVAIAYGVVRLVVAFASSQLPRADAIEVNSVTLAVAVALALVATAAFAIVAVYGQQRAEGSRALQAATRGGTGTRTARRTQRTMVVVQVTLAVTVILGAGLVARSQLNLETLDLGLAGDRILIIEVVPPQQDDYDNPKAFNAGVDRIIRMVAALPGVQGVAPLLSPPFGGMSGWDARYLLDGQAPGAEARQPLLNLEIASPAFFRTLGIEIVRGRAFTGEDTAEGRPAVILSESAARLAWPNKDAVGERMKIAGTWATVVGVAADTRYRELTAIRPTAYRPRAQFEAAPPFLAVRTAGDPNGLGPAIRSAGRAMWPGATMTSRRRLDGYSSEPLARSRVTAALFVAFAGVCLLLSTIGVYGVVTAHVVERTRGIAIRMALGAPGGHRAPSRLARRRDDDTFGNGWRRGNRRALRWLARNDSVRRQPARRRDDRGCRGPHVSRDRCSELYSCQTCRQRRADRSSSRGVRWRDCPCAALLPRDSIRS